MKNPKRKIGTKNSLLDFLLTYFPKKFKYKFGKNHLRFIERLQYNILNDGKQAIGMPRGVGKTTVEKGAALWALAHGHRKYTVIVAASVNEGKAVLDDIKTMVVSKTFSEDFPEISYPLQCCGMTGRLTGGQRFNGTPTAIEVDKTQLRFPTIAGSRSSGALIQTVGIGGKIRGKAAGMADGDTIRPDFIIIDDPQTDDDAINPNRVAKLEKKIDKTIGGLAAAGSDAAMVMSCTVIEPGDLADRFLNREIRPGWNGLRFATVEKFPDRMDLWQGEYARLFRTVSQKAATRFYETNRAEMDAGAVIDQEDRFNPKQESSCVERAMKKMLESEEAFWSEMQNAPRGAKKASIYVDAATIRKRLNGYERGVVPTEAQRLTAFIDVHDAMLYWTVTAWADDFTGYIIDYGTFPEQERKHFSKDAAGNITLQNIFPGTKQLGAIRAGVEKLLSELIGRNWKTEDETDVSIERIFVDSGYSYKPVESAIRMVPGARAIVRPSKGEGIGAKKKPMDEYNRKDGEVYGNHWLEGKVGKRTLRTVKIDTNFWKTDVHDSFGLSVSDRGGLSLWGKKGETHRMFSEHMNAEDVVLVKAGENEVYEWIEKVGAPDNHFFDCMVGCAAAASHIGIKKSHEKDEPRRTRRKTKVYKNR